MEEKKEEEKKPEEVKPSAFDRLDEMKEVLRKTEEAASRVEAANEKTSELQGRQMMGGQTDAGVQPEKEKTKSEEAAEYFKGTQLEKDIRKANE